MRLGRIAARVSAGASMVLATAVLAGSAGAATPAPSYSQFRGCPSAAENPSIEACIHSEVVGGHFKMGNKDVPITNPIKISGGVGFGLSGFSANSEGGMTAAKQKVPGGVIGLTGLTWLAEVLGIEALTLYAVTELAGQPEIGFTTISLPIKVHLINPVLGSKCYVGSSSSPIRLSLTTGTTSPPAPAKPISGIEPEFGFNEALEIVKLTHGTYVDNAFSAPAASGCVLNVLGLIPVNIDGIVDLASALPAKAGTNETAQVINTELAPEPLVYP